MVNIFWSYLFIGTLITLFVHWEPWRPLYFYTQAVVQIHFLLIMIETHERWSFGPKEILTNTLRKSFHLPQGKHMRLTPHSFRSGGATLAFKLGINPLIIQKMGNWKSFCFTGYVHVDDLALNDSAMLLARRAASIWIQARWLAVWRHNSHSWGVLPDGFLVVITLEVQIFTQTAWSIFCSVTTSTLTSS